MFTPNLNQKLFNCKKISKKRQFYKQQKSITCKNSPGLKSKNRNKQERNISY